MNPKLTIDPLHFYKALADDTRLQTMLLIASEGELCVCELTAALELSQPKISRHLAQLRACGLLQDRRAGQWVHYQLNPNLPEWVTTVLGATLRENESYVQTAQQRLEAMHDRPERLADCC